MKGIRLSHGTIFVTDGIVTVRLLTSGECGASPISYAVLEHDLSTEPPSSREYISEGEIRALSNGDGDRIAAAIKRMHDLMKS